ncbi:hypothetical protein CBS101457_005780 [Exobasidium rhododendri]|nr:hypothetical protein CBS101457_005780 [Exobasidium rhododendri]
MVEYSERHRVPTVQEYRQIEAEREKTSQANASQLPETEADESAPKVPSKDDTAPKDDTDTKPSGGGQEEKDRLMAQMAPKGKPTDFEAKGERLVQDPVTGGQVQIADDTKNADVPPHKLDSRFEGGYSSNVPKGDSSHDSKFVSPKPAEPGNILLQQFPPALNPESLTKLSAKFQGLAVALGVAMSIAWFFTAFGAGWFRFFLRSTIFGGIGIGGWMALGVAARTIEKDFEDVRMHMHKQRGEEHSPPMPESVEWLNAAIAVIWKQINPDMFIPMVDQVEDIMQQSLPGVVSAVKISDVGHGTNPFRFIAFRGLADVMGDPEYPREQWIAQGKAKEENVPKEQIKKEKAEKEEEKKAIEADSDQDGVADDDESGDFLCYEISFSYSAEPGKKGKNDYIHLMLTFFLGNDLFRLPLNVWAQVQKISGTVRLRAQMVESPPYIRNMTISLMGVPNIEVGVIPMSRLLPNVLDLPVISGFVKSSIAAACNEYVAPKSMTLNMAQMLSGDGVKKDTDSVGVLCVQLLRGEDLSAQDANGQSDPYVVVSFAKFGRPLYSTRIIFEDLNPNWNETANLLVTKEDIRADETLSIQLWDSDKRTADDIVGRVQRKLSDLVKGENVNKFVELEDGLMGFEDADTMQGKLHWRVGFFEKAKLNRDLIKTEEQKKGDTALQKEATERQATLVDSNEEADALRCPPDTRWPSGILSIQVDSIIGLERRDVEKGVKGKEREGSQGQDVHASGETPDHLPNGYCELILNDDIIYKTRVKMQTNLPFFSAGTEVFVRDWTKANVRIAVRDSRMREHDPLMGVVDLNVADLFKDSSQVTGAYSIQDGVGYGKVNCSFVFKAVKMELPRNLRGWDTATVELLSNIEVEGIDAEWDAKLKSKKIAVTTGDTTEKLMTADKQAHTRGETDEPLARLPVYDRYSSQLSFSIGGGGIGPLGGKPEAVASLSLSEIVDDEVTDLELPILAGEKLGSLVRNHLDEFTEKTHKYHKVGTLRVKARLDSGLDLDHEKLAIGQTDRHGFEVKQRLELQPKIAEQNAHANDDGVIDKDEQKQINRAKTQALHSRHRGVMGYSVARGAVWSKDNAKNHVRALKNTLTGKKERDQTVKSEV